MEGSDDKFSDLEGDYHDDIDEGDHDPMDDTPPSSRAATSGPFGDHESTWNTTIKCSSLSLP